MVFTASRPRSSNIITGQTAPPVLRMASLFSGTVVAGFAMFLAACLAGLAVGMSPALAEQFAPPSLDGFVLHSEREGDGDGDGIEETHITQYVNENGDSLVSMTTNGRVWAWSLDTRDNELGPDNYVIRDSDCDGVFDEVYGLDDQFHVPECVK